LRGSQWALRGSQWVLKPAKLHAIAAVPCNLAQRLLK
jgi:hypothetical protein